MTTAMLDSPPTRVSPSWLRFAGIAGIAGTLLWVGLGVGIAASAPTLVDPAGEIRAWFSENQGSVALFTWLMSFVFGPLMLVFAAGLRSRLAAVDVSGVLPRLSFSAAVAQFGMGLVGLAFWGVLSLDPVLETASDGLLVALSALDTVAFFTLAPWASALFVVSASVVVMLRTRAMPAWLGALGCGHMFSFLDAGGVIALRLSDELRAEFLSQFDGGPVMQYGKVMRGYVAVPDELLHDTDELVGWFNRSQDWVGTLPPKTTRRLPPTA